ncbi:MAG: antitoxin VapB family protein [Thermoplasmatota archaeon]
MTSKNVSLKEETYELISREKLPGESFSDTIERLVKRRGKLMDAVKSWDEVDKDEVDEIEENIEKARKKFTSEMKERA